MSWLDYQPPLLDECEYDLIREDHGNEFLKEIHRLMKTGKKRYFNVGTEYSTDRRSGFTERYAWAIPSTAGIEKVVGHLQSRNLKKLVSIGAGTGFWESLIDKAWPDGDVSAFDICPPYFSAEGPPENAYRHEKQYMKIQEGTEVDAARFGKDSALFLCWPPCYKPMAANSLRFFKGDFLVYVGEGWGGCTANNEFFDLLGKEWRSVENFFIPTWSGASDYLQIYERK